MYLEKGKKPEFLVSSAINRRNYFIYIFPKTKSDMPDTVYYVVVKFALCFLPGSENIFIL